MFSDDIVKALKAPLSASYVKARKQGGRDVSYVEGWHVIAEANRIFGFDAWTSETVDLRCVAEHARAIGSGQKPGHGVSYIAKVRVTVGDVIREGVGAGHGIDVDLGQAHESAIKEAETDARKRALMTFGNPFGLALYDKDRTNVATEADESKSQFIEWCKERIAASADYAELGLWWNSDEQKSQRRKFGLDNSEVSALKEIVMARRAQLEGKKAA